MSSFSNVTAATLEDVRMFCASLAAESLGTGWSLESLEKELHLTQSRVVVVHEEGSHSAASLMVYWVLPDGLELLNIYTLSAFRRAGVARMMMQFLLTQCRALRLGAVVLEVRASNEPALSLYQELGFLEVGRRHGYYAEGGEDAVVMRWEPLAE